MGWYDLATTLALIASRIVAYCLQVIVKTLGVFLANFVNVVDNGISSHLVMPLSGFITHILSFALVNIRD